MATYVCKCGDKAAHAAILASKPGAFTRAKIAHENIVRAALHAKFATVFATARKAANAAVKSSGVKSSGNRVSGVVISPSNGKTARFVAREYGAVKAHGGMLVKVSQTGDAGLIASRAMADSLAASLPKLGVDVRLMIVA